MGKLIDVDTIPFFLEENGAVVAYKADIEQLSSTQPEIVRCKDCKYRDENGRRVSVRWLPCMDVRTGSNWFCGSAERRTDEADNRKE